MMTILWLIPTVIAAFGVGLGVRVIVNARRIRRERDRLAVLRRQQPATGETIRLRPVEPPRELPCRRRDDPLPPDLRRGGDTLRVIARRRPRS